MDNRTILEAIKTQTDAVIVEMEAYKRGYLNALAFVAQKIQDSEKVSDIQQQESVTDKQMD